MYVEVRYLWWFTASHHQGADELETLTIQRPTKCIYVLYFTLAFGTIKDTIIGWYLWYYVIVCFYGTMWIITSHEIPVGTCIFQHIQLYILR